MSDFEKKDDPISNNQSKSLKGDTWEDLSGIVEIEGASRPMKIRPSLPPTSPSKFRVKGLRLLIIDNDPIRVDALAMDLRNLGAQVAVGDLSTSGYSQAAKFLPDAVISDLVRPGEQGFLFIQNLRRHPLLRWCSVILLRWWQETSEGEGQVILDRVLDQLEEVLAPIRIIEERIAARRPLSDRIEMTGPAALLRLLSSAGLSGSLSVNDTWNMFTVDIAEGRILSAFRKGIDGEADEQIDALMQLMLCDVGKWTFAEKKHQSIGRTLNTEDTLALINRNLSRLFGRTSKSFEDLEQHVLVRPYFLRTASETVSPSAIEIAQEIADGADIGTFKQFFAKKSDLSDVERIVHTLFRCGAIRFTETPGKAVRSAKEIAASRSVVNLLKALVDNPFAPQTIKSSFSSAASPAVVEVGLESPSDRPPARGAYHLQDVAPERLVSAKQRPLRLQLGEGRPTPGAPPHVKDVPIKSSALYGSAAPIELSEDLEIDRPSTTDIIVPQDRGRPLGAEVSDRPSESTDADESGSRKFILESQRIAVGDLPPEWKIPIRREKKQMWAAIVLAIFLASLLAAGIAFVASHNRPTSADSDLP
jgi:CheY-like chemotaxis protein